ncbi:MAG: hypothetical protein AMS27_12580 [Bacteroides sp. SM23_62_1]|nr:MAG: hypothetical protein AMS27_12580 [Bacteroides sp. SM23_62_1]
MSTPAAGWGLGRIETSKVEIRNKKQKTRIENRKSKLRKLICQKFIPTPITHTSAPSGAKFQINRQPGINSISI